MQGSLADGEAEDELEDFVVGEGVPPPLLRSYGGQGEAGAGEALLDAAVVAGVGPGQGGIVSGEEG